MKKQPSSTGRKPLPGLSVFPLLITICLLSILSSCGSNPKKEPQAFSGESPKEGAATISCLKLTKAQVQTWVDSGWTKPGSEGAINDILLQFYSPDATSSSSNIQLVAYPGPSISSLKIRGRQVLTPDTTCTGLTLTGGVIFANIQVSIKALGILNDDGTLKDFDYIRLTPVRINKYNDYIGFNMEKVGNGVLMNEAPVMLPPCPPVCCPPDCDNNQ